MSPFPHSSHAVRGVVPSPPLFQPAICQVGINVLQAFAASTRYPFLKDAACRIIRNVGPSHGALCGCHGIVLVASQCSCCCGYKAAAFGRCPAPQISKHPRNRTIIYASELSQKTDQFYDDILAAIRHADAAIDRVKPPGPSDPERCTAAAMIPQRRVA